MTNYVQLERDFMERTLEIIKQYDLHIKPNLPENQQYEVTLLMNCLLGILVFPQQIATKQHNQQYFDNWLTQDLLKDLTDWGITTADVQNAGHTNKGKKITPQELTLRNLIRQMRNCVAHASFCVIDTDPNKHIEMITFKSDKTDGLYVDLPVSQLKTFVKN